MTKTTSPNSRSLSTHDGPTATEYCVLLSMVILGCLVAIRGSGLSKPVTPSKVAASQPVQPRS